MGCRCQDMTNLSNKISEVNGLKTMVSRARTGMTYLQQDKTKAGTALCTVVCEEYVQNAKSKINELGNSLSGYADRLDSKIDEVVRNMNRTMTELRREDGAWHEEQRQKELQQQKEN